MKKEIAGLVGAIASMGAFNAAEAAPLVTPTPTDILQANSFADLLEPIPNAAQLLQVVDEAGTPRVDENIQTVQYYHHHHHHHHHSQYRRYAPRVIIVPPRYRRHHHHHHHHHSFYRRDY